MSSLSRAVGSIAVGLVLLLGLTWFDADPLWYAQRQAGANFNSAGYSVMWALGALAMSGSVLLMGALAWRSHSLLLGLVYAICYGTGLFFIGKLNVTGGENAAGAFIGLPLMMMAPALGAGLLFALFARAMESIIVWTRWLSGLDRLATPGS